MRVAELRDDPGIGSLVLGKRPDPPAPHAGEVLVRLEAASLNYRDLVMIEGGYGRLRLPLIPCSDGAGHVVAVGPGVTDFVPGDLVTPTFAQGWMHGRWRGAYRHTTLGGPLDGTLREWMTVPSTGLVKAPAGLTPGEAACLPCAAVTAWNAVVVRGRIKPGQVVVVQGTGGVALFALQFARLAGAAVFLTSSSSEKLARLAASGVARAINYRDEPAWGELVRKETGGGADLVIDVAGADSLDQSLRAVRPGGRIALIGVLSGREARLDLAKVVLQDIRLEGVTVGSREVHQEVARAMERHRVHPILDKVFPLASVREAFERMKRGEHMGKIVVSLAS